MCAQLASGELAVSGDQWLLLVYEKGAYVPEEPWDGLFRNELLIWVSCTHFFLTCIYCLFRCEQAFKHIFTLPQFCGERDEGNQIWERLHTWDDSGHYGFLGIRSDTGMFTGDSVPRPGPYGSSALHCLPPRS